MAQLKDTTITGGLSVSGTVNITGETQTNNDVTLYKSSGDSPSIIFQRGTSTDNLNDYKITDSGGFLKIKQRGNSSTSGFTQVAELTNQGTFTVSTPPTTDTTPSVTSWISPTDSSVKISTDATIASGDKLVIRDSSDSNKMRSSSISFGTSTSTYLRNDGTWGTPSGGGGGGVTPSDIVVKGYDSTGETTLYSGNLGSGLAVIEPLVLDDASVPELAIQHQTSGVTAGTYSGEYNSKTLGYYMPSVTVDDTGHVTSASNAGSLIVRARDSTMSAYGSPNVGLMTSTEYNTLNSGIDFLFPHIFGDASNNDAAFTIAAGSSSKTVTVSYSVGNINTSNFSHYQYPGKLIQSSSLSLCSVIGVVSYLVNTSTHAVEPVLVDWSATSGNSSGTVSTGSSQTVTVTLSDPVPTGYTLMFKILFSTQYFGH